MKFIVIEIQKQANGTVGNIVTAFDDKSAALSAFFTTCAAAAISDLPVHSVVCMTEDARIIEREVFKVPEEEE